MKITDINNIQIVGQHPQEAIDFFTSVLGLKLIKQTIDLNNLDKYVLYFSTSKETDKQLIMVTFAGKASQIKQNPASTIFCVPKNSFNYWMERLANFNIKVTKIDRFKETYLSFTNLAGARFELVESSKVTEGKNIISLVGVSILSDDVVTFKKYLQADLNFMEADKNHMYYRMINNDIIIDLYKTNTKLDNNIIGSIKDIAFNLDSKSVKVEDLGRALSYTYYDAFKVDVTTNTKIKLVINNKGMLFDSSKSALGKTLKLPKYLTSKKDEIIKSLPPLFIKDVSEIESYNYTDKSTFKTQEEHKALLKRINELAKKNKTKKGLSEAEKNERALLRKKYISNVLRGVNSSVDNVRVVEDDGSKSKINKKG